MNRAPIRRPATERPERGTGRELVIRCSFAASAERVFEAWTDPAQLRLWAAPRVFEITHSEGDLRPGGSWRTCMRAPDGHEYWVGGLYREIVPSERLVFTHAWDDSDGNPRQETVVTVTLRARQEGTAMRFRQGPFASADSRDGHREGWLDSFERLHRHLDNPVRPGGE